MKKLKPELLDTEQQPKKWPENETIVAQWVSPLHRLVVTALAEKHSMDFRATVAGPKNMATGEPRTRALLAAVDRLRFMADELEATARGERAITYDVGHEGKETAR